MFDAESIEFLESGCSLIVATVNGAGEPRATRGWGIEVTDPDHGDLRVFLDADDEPTIEHLREGDAVAVTATCVATLRSLQLKGRSAGIEPITEAELRLVRAQSDAFFDAIHRNDGTPRELPARLFPAAFVACAVTVGEHFDQTPGPQAGSRMTGRG